jgi:hypothetical protein
MQQAKAPLPQLAAEGNGALVGLRRKSGKSNVEWTNRPLG